MYCFWAHHVERHLGHVSGRLVGERLRALRKLLEFAQNVLQKQIECAVANAALDAPLLQLMGEICVVLAGLTERERGLLELHKQPQHSGVIINSASFLPATLDSVAGSHREHRGLE